MGKKRKRKKRSKMKIKIVVEEKPLRKGHSPHRSGAGSHEDRRKKRQKTRGDKLRKILSEE